MSAATLPTEQLKRFLFSAKSEHGEHQEQVEAVIPEKLEASYSLYTWPCAPYLAWYLYEVRKELVGKTILELGAGTALPSVVAAKCGAKVIISDSATLPSTLRNIHHICTTNALPQDKYRVIGLSWGLFFNQVFDLGPIDLIIASDCFYEPLLFEDIIATISFLLDRNPSARFVVAYQERSADWSVQHLLRRYSLWCQVINPRVLGATTKLDTNHLVQGHTIHLLQCGRLPRDGSTRAS